MAKRESKATKKVEAKRRPSLYRRQGSAINPTEAALLGRSVDRATATKLRTSGWTLAKLKATKDSKLKALGLTPLAIASIRKGDRSDIPFDELAKVLIANRFTCCICHNSAKSIVVHHICEWAKSHDHSPSNLAVLCVDDHDKVHTKKELSRNLTPQLVRAAKAAWEKDVRQFDPTAILDASRAEDSAWQYFNHTRLFELAKGLGVSFVTLDHFNAALADGVVNANGLLASSARSARRSYMYDGGDNIVLYMYVRDVLHAVLETLTILNISDFLDRGVLLPVIKSGDFIVVQGAHQFSPKDKKARGTDQPAQGRRRANHVEVQYLFNLFEATSSSAYNLWLRGRHASTSIVRVGTVRLEKGRLTIVGTVIAIANGFGQLRTRDYIATERVRRKRKITTIQI
ncbi:HNH endonuclease [Rhodopseudomonas palustris TIE-1]|uniref:HNH endonuclease signature motif containing protein n=1 Tax=Rhodopseudomonas palustris TaxID=1076 RepID=UPI000164A852|nr:HNH endonuclease signature motif containing protein [Rhodopseudomonas palustris]ACF02176.1 HNH endonuclease [Rhodopseudomonas palustris TIE-1]